MRRLAQPGASPAAGGQAPGCRATSSARTHAPSSLRACRAACRPSALRTSAASGLLHGTASPLSDGRHHGLPTTSSIAARQGGLRGHRRAQQQQQQRGSSLLARATIDDPELADLVQKMEAQRPSPPEQRDQLVKAINMIDEANARDPNKVEWNGRRVPYRLLYSHWLTEWVEKLDPKAPDELIILARGRNMESWRLAEIKRDDYSPNSAGARQWEVDRRKAQASRLTDVMRAAGYGEMSVKLVEEVMLDRDIPDPRDIRRHDLVAPLGLINYRLLEEACMIQALRDADALVFVEKSFPQMFSELSADEVLPVVQRELARISNKAAAIILNMNWGAAQKKLLVKALPAPRRFGTILKAVEGVASASTHPGDWRYRDFDYD